MQKYNKKSQISKAFIRKTSYKDKEYSSVDDE